MSMHQVRLRDATALDRAEFLSVAWDRFEAGLPTGLRRIPVVAWLLRKAEMRSIVYEESQARESGAARDFEAAERIYRQLRQSHASRVDAPRVGDFYYGEMEMRRLARRGWWGLRPFLENSYRILSGYGERWWLALCWLLVLVVISALFYAAAGVRESVPGAVGGTHDWIDTRFGRPTSPTDLVNATITVFGFSLATATLLARIFP